METIKMSIDCRRNRNNIAVTMKRSIEKHYETYYPNKLINSEKGLTCSLISEC